MGFVRFAVLKVREPLHGEVAGLATDEPTGVEQLGRGSDAEGERFAKLQLRLTVVPFDQAAKIEEDPLVQAKMRDRILTLLTGKSYEELSTPVGKEGFRREIKTVLSPLLEKGEIQEVLFQDFVVQ